MRDQDLLSYATPVSSSFLATAVAPADRSVLPDDDVNMVTLHTNTYVTTVLFIYSY
jgi:hypothetical protein